MSDITDRLDALEAKLLTVADLPIAALQRKLEQNWQPDASVLLQPGSITTDLLPRFTIALDLTCNLAGAVINSQTGEVVSATRTGAGVVTVTLNRTYSKLHVAAGSMSGGYYPVSASIDGKSFTAIYHNAAGAGTDAGRITWLIAVSL